MVDVKVNNGLELDTPPDSIHKLCPSSPDSSKAEKVFVPDEKEVWRKVDRRLLPILAVMYLFSFMDRGAYLGLFTVRLVLVLMDVQQTSVSRNPQIDLFSQFEAVFSKVMPGCKDSKRS